MSKRGTMPSIRAIVDAQAPLIERIGLEAPAAKQCWACGAIGHVDRAHIVAHSDGGSMHPSNFFLLCGVCHREQPDHQAVDAQIFWLLTHESQSARILRITRPYLDAIAAGTMTVERAREMIQSRAA
jgi:hypothetical protein